MKETSKLKDEIMDTYRTQPTYRFQKKTPHWIWALVIITLMFTALILYSNATAQHFDITKRFNACNSIESVNITAYYPADVHTMSLVMFYDSTYWELGAVARSDVFINGYALDSIHSNRWVFSWFSTTPLKQTTILFRLIFIRKSYGGMNHDLEWSVKPDDCEITDFNAVPIPCQFNNGFMRCVPKNVKHETDMKKLERITILGQIK